MANDHTLLLVALGGKLVALDRENGARRWDNDLKGGGYGTVALAASQGRVFVSAHAAKVFCLDYATGNELWTASTQSSGRATLVVEGGRVYVAKSGKIDAFTVDGAKVWSEDLPGTGIGSVALGFPGNIVQSDDIGGQ